MAALDPNVAVVRTAIRRAMRGRDGGRALVACSGGADSLALAQASRFVLPRLGVSVGLVTVDHQLQSGSAERAQSVAAWADAAGFDPVAIRTVTVEGRPGGPEAAARAARYDALVAAAHEYKADTILLGHTQDDQAETVLLALVRGAGGRGISGMPLARAVHGVTLLRPLLGVSRARTHAACAALDLTPWHDPHNVDPAYARSRARTLMTSVVSALGPGVVANLARTAELAAADQAVIDELAASALLAGLDDAGHLQVDAIQTLPVAVRRAVLRAWIQGLGVPGSDLSHRHIEALDALVVGWHGQGAVALPTGVEVVRADRVVRPFEKSDNRSTSRRTRAGHKAGLGHG